MRLLQWFYTQAEIERMSSEVLALPLTEDILVQNLPFPITVASFLPFALVEGVEQTNPITSSDTLPLGVVEGTVLNFSDPPLGTGQLHLPLTEEPRVDVTVCVTPVVLPLKLLELATIFKGEFIASAQGGDSFSIGLTQAGAGPVVSAVVSMDTIAIPQSHGTVIHAELVRADSCMIHLPITARIAINMQSQDSPSLVLDETHRLCTVFFGSDSTTLGWVETQEILTSLCLQESLVLGMSRGQALLVTAASTGEDLHLVVDQGVQILVQESSVDVLSVQVLQDVIQIIYRIHGGDMVPLTVSIPFVDLIQMTRPPPPTLTQFAGLGASWEADPYTSLG